jgi:hypothetical protein
MRRGVSLTLLACLLALGAAVDQPPFITYDQLGGQPYTVTHDNRSFMINGQRSLLLGGSFHYPRSSPGDWPLFFEKAKQDGLNHIQTYVFWFDLICCGQSRHILPNMLDQPDVFFLSWPFHFVRSCTILRLSPGHWCR